MVSQSMRACSEMAGDVRLMYSMPKSERAVALGKHQYAVGATRGQGISCSHLNFGLCYVMTLVVCYSNCWIVLVPGKKEKIREPKGSSRTNLKTDIAKLVALPERAVDDVEITSVGGGLGGR